jgi:pimeloyl-ACP methyl ester carboxylesterase
LPGSNNSLKLLASGLAERGIASLRYDKRGIAASAKAMTAEQDLRFTNSIDDAAGWVEKLRLDPRFSTITIAGHSEGSLIGMVAASQASADAFVSLEGAGRKPREIIIEQLTGQLPAETVDQARVMLEQLEAGTIPDSTTKAPPMLYALFRPSVRPYLASWFRFDPAVEIAKLTVPVMVVQGTNDLQVKMTDANALAAAFPAGRLLVIEGMNHVLKAAPADRAGQMPSYSDPAIPVVPRLLDEMATFVKSVRLRSR